MGVLSDLGIFLKFYVRHTLYLEGFGFAAFKSIRALRKLQNHPGGVHILDGKQIDPKSSRKDIKACRLHLSGLNPSTTHETLR